MKTIADIQLKLKPFLKTYHNITLINYPKTYLIPLFPGDWYEPFSKKYVIIIVILFLIEDLMSIITLCIISVFSRGKESYESTLILI